MMYLLRVWGPPSQRAAGRKSGPQGGVGQLLWLAGAFILLFSPMPNPKETQQKGDEDTRAEPTLTISIEFDPSPAGTQAGRRRETDELGTPGMSPGQRLWAAKPPMEP